MPQPPKIGVAKDPLVTRQGRERVDHGPNPFLVREEGSGLTVIEKSYENGETMEFVADGTWEMAEATRGATKGQPIEKLTGDARIYTQQIREAAALMGLGVSIQYHPVMRSGKEIPGKLLIKFLAKSRKQRREKPVEGTSDAPTVDTADTSVPQ